MKGSNNGRSSSAGDRRHAGQGIFFVSVRVDHVRPGSPIDLHDSPAQSQGAMLRLVDDGYATADVTSRLGQEAIVERTSSAVTPGCPPCCRSSPTSMVSAPPTTSPELTCTTVSFVGVASDSSELGSTASGRVAAVAQGGY